MKTTQTPRHPRRSAKQWAKLVAEAATVQGSLDAFCAQNNISLTMLRRWQWRLTGTTPAAPAKLQPAAAFVPVRVVHPPQAKQADGEGRLEIVLAQGRVVRIMGEVDAQQLRRVLDVADGRLPC